MSFSQLECTANGIASFLKRKHITEGTRVLLMVKPGIELIGITFALFKLGAVPVIIDPGMGVKNFLNCVKRVQPQALIGIPLAMALARVFSSHFKYLKSRVSVTKSFLAKTGTQPDFPPAKTDPDALAAILFTSGSTGAPKGVTYTHGIFDAQIRMIRDAYQIQPGEVDLPMLPIFALFNPAMGVTTIVPEMNPSRPADVDPKTIVDTLIKENVTTTFGSPVIWRKIANYCEAHSITLPSIKRILMAGCSVPPSIMERYLKIIPNGTVHAPYGATEALPVSTVSTQCFQKDPELLLPGKGSYIGQAYPDNTIKIIKITDKPIRHWSASFEVPAGEIGEIIVSGPIVTQSYFNLPKETAQSKIYDGHQYWHRMGDLGYFDEKGRLWFCGRKAERVQTFSGTLYTDCCESVLNAHPQVNRSALIPVQIQNTTVPAFVVEPNSGTWPRNRAERNRLTDELRTFAKKHPSTENVDLFFYHKQFPTDVRHNAKIHRATLSKIFQP